MESEEQDYSFGKSLMNASITAKMRTRQSFCFREIDIDDEPIEYDESFEELLKQTWTVWAVSSLFGFEYNNELKMKLYAKKLREEIARSLSKDDVSYTAKFTLMDDFGPKPNPTDVPAVQIELFATLGTVETRVYRGLLISWRTSLIEPINDNCVNLPLLLCKGTQSTIKAVHSIISRMFDCIVTALPITEYDLKWLTAINLYGKSSKGKSKDDIMLLEYVIPGLPLTDTLTVHFRSEDLKKLWTTLCITTDENIQTIRTDHIEKLFKVIEKQMLHVASLKLGLCTLHRLSLPTLSIIGNRMKVMNEETLNNTLLFLNEVALEVLYSLNCHQSNTLSGNSNNSLANE